MQQYPIWNRVFNGAYKTSKDFGARNDGYSMNILVGTSSRNSHLFADINVHRSQDGKHFTLFVDDVAVRSMKFDDKWNKVTN